MEIKIKKQNPDGIVKLETSGQVKEILINEDLLSPKDASIAVCFRGKNSSGIIELDSKEFEKIYRGIAPNKNLMKNIKIMKFDKEDD